MVVAAVCAPWLASPAQGAPDDTATADDATAGAGIGFDGRAPIEIDADGVAVTIINRSTSAWDTTLAAFLFTDDGSPAATYLSTPQSQTIPPGEARAFHVAPAQSDQITSRVEGALVLTASTADRTVHESRTARGGPSVGAEPVSDLLKITSTQLVPFTEKTGEIEPTLPLTQGATCPPSGSIPISDGTNTGSLHYGCTAKGSISELEFEGASLSEVGDYTGTLKVGATEVSVEVRRSTHILWAISTLLAGFLVALVWNTSTATRQPLNRLLRSLEQLTARATAAQDQFMSGANGEPYVTYHLDLGMQRENADIRSMVLSSRPGLRSNWFRAFVPVAQDELKQLVDRVTERLSSLQWTIERWEGLAGGMAALKTKKDEIEAHGSLVPLAPTLVGHADALVDPAPTAISPSFEEAIALLNDVTSTTDALELLAPTHELIAWLSDVEPEQTDEFDYPVWARANQLLRQVRMELLESRSGADVESAGVDSLLRDARRLALQLMPMESAWTVQSLGAPGPGEAGYSVTPISLFRRLTGGLASATFPHQAMNVGWFLLALGIALWTGLSLLYIDEPWGSLTDFIAMFVWAIGVVTVVPILLSALQTMGDGPAVIPERGADAEAAS